jgi:hypothetical protein
MVTIEWLRRPEMAGELEIYGGDAAWNLGREAAADIGITESELPEHCRTNPHFMAGYRVVMSWEICGRALRPLKTLPDAEG